MVLIYVFVIISDIEPLFIYLLAICMSLEKYLFWPLTHFLGFSGSSDGKESACSAGDTGLIPGLGRSPGEGNGNPLQYCCLDNSMNRGAWQHSPWGHKESDTTEWLVLLPFLHTNPPFNQDVSFLLWSYRHSLYILEISSLSDNVVYKYFLPFCRLPFHSLDYFLCVQKLFS